MKPALLIVIMLLQLRIFAQQPPSPHQLNLDGYRYLKGIGRPYRPEEAARLFLQSASMGDAQAMNALGNLYAKGIGRSINTDSALYWYKAAAANGYASACLNLGRLYKTGTDVQQDFSKAVSYFKQGAALQDKESLDDLAYMYYKGFGTSQDYYRAFELFKQSAGQGSTNAMYYLGLCYRNGYGTPANTELAKQWLSKAAGSENVQSIHELYNEPLPENRSTISPELENKLTVLKTYQEKYQSSADNNYEGTYTGFAVYYDWSGKYVSDIHTLVLTLHKTSSGYEGSWKEGSSNAAPIALAQENNTLTFSESSEYTRVDHYSGRTAEEWQFNQAQLHLGFMNDSVQLSGNVQFHSIKRNEPGKPLQVILKKPVVFSDALLKNIQFSLSPNPAATQTNSKFTLVAPAKTGMIITSQDGTVVYTEPDRLLPAGTYSYPITLNGLAAGVYDISIKVNGKIIATKQLVKQ